MQHTTEDQERMSAPERAGEGRSDDEAIDFCMHGEAVV